MKVLEHIILKLDNFQIGRDITIRIQVLLNISNDTFFIVKQFEMSTKQFYEHSLSHLEII